MTNNRFSISGMMLPFAAIFLAGCTLTGPSTQGEPEDLDSARNAWRQLGNSDYDMTLFRGCFCIGAGEMTVFVRGDSVAAIQQTERQWQSSNDWWQYIPTVNGLFALIAEAEADAYSVEAEYHPQLGYPTSVTIDWIKDAVDDEIFYSVAGLSLTAVEEVIRLEVGSEVSLPSGQLLRLERIAEDSRCALNAQCIWAGRVQIVIAITRGGDHFEVVLTHGEQHEGDSSTANIAGLTLRVVDVSPYPQDAGSPIPTGSYVARLTVSAN
jgi:hypothetical protein